MKKIIFLSAIATLSILSTFVTTTKALAADLPNPVVKSISISGDASNIKAGDLIQGTVDLINLSGVAGSDMYLKVSLVGNYSKDTGLAGEVYDSQVISSSKFSIDPSEEKSLPFQYKVPTYAVKGDMGIQVGVYDDSGTPYGWSDKRIVITSGSIASLVKSAYVQYGNAKYGLEDGVSIDSATLPGYVHIDFNPSKLGKVYPSVTIFNRTLVDSSAQVFSGKIDPINLSGSAVTSLKYEIENSLTPGVYEGTISLDDSAGNALAGEVPFRFVVPGDVVSILRVTPSEAKVTSSSAFSVNVSLAGTPASINLPVFLNASSSSKKLSVGLSIVDKDNNIVWAGKKDDISSLNIGDVVFDDVSINSGSGFSAKVVVAEENGSIIGSKTFDLPVVVIQKSSGLLTNPLFLALIALIIIILLAIFTKKKTTTKIAALLLVVSSLVMLGSVTKVHAWTFVSHHTRNTSLINKTVLSLGQPVLPIYSIYQSSSNDWAPASLMTTSFTKDLQAENIKYPIDGKANLAALVAYFVNAFDGGPNIGGTLMQISGVNIVGADQATPITAAIPSGGQFYVRYNSVVRSCTNSNLGLYSTATNSADGAVINTVSTKEHETVASANPTPVTDNHQFIVGPFTAGTSTGKYTVDLQNFYYPRETYYYTTQGTTTISVNMGSVSYDAGGAYLRVFEKGTISYSVVASTSTATTTPTNVCANGASDYPTCTPPPVNCTNGATNYPTCTLNNGGSCVNGDIDPPACVTPAPNACTNGATDPGKCTTCPTNQCLLNNVCTSGSGSTCSATGNLVNSCGFLVKACANGCTTDSSGNGVCKANVATDNLSLTVNPTHVQSGGSCTIFWDVQGADSCKLDGVGISNYSIPLDSSGSGTGSKQGGALNSSATYTLNCTQGSASTIKTSTCTVTPTVIEN